MSPESFLNALWWELYIIQLQIDEKILHHSDTWKYNYLTPRNVTHLFHLWPKVVQPIQSIAQLHRTACLRIHLIENVVEKQRNTASSRVPALKWRHSKVLVVRIKEFRPYLFKLIVLLSACIEGTKYCNETISCEPAGIEDDVCCGGYYRFCPKTGFCEDSALSDTECGVGSSGDHDALFK